MRVLDGVIMFALMAGIAACAKVEPSTDNMIGYPTIPALPEQNGLHNVEDILRSYAEAWKGIQEFDLRSPYTISFWIEDEAYAIELTNEGAIFSDGAPEDYEWGFVTDTKTLSALNTGKMNALTAMGQATSSDPIPLQPRVPDDFDGSELRSYHIPLLQHFWNREWPETIPFGDGATRQVHGANTAALIYDKGLRSAWYQLNPGMHINADLADQVNEFDTAVIVTRGTFSGKLDGVERAFKEGETVIIPEGMTHEFYTEPDQYGEFIILMWGDKA